MWQRVPSYDVETVEERLRRWAMVGSDSGTTAVNAPASLDIEGAGESVELTSEHPRVVRVARITTCLRPIPGVLYAHTLPQLSDRTIAILRGELRSNTGPYRGYRAIGQRAAQNPSLRMLRTYRAAQLLSSVYARCLDPVHFHSSTRSALSKDDVVNAFARGLLAERTREAVEILADGIRDIRSLDGLQSGVGTSTARWMQYLAREALSAETLQIGQFTPKDRRNLRSALEAIGESVTAVDRFTALSHGIDL